MYIGNDAIHDLTKSGKAKLRIDLRRFSGEEGNVTYSTFKVGEVKVDTIYNVFYATSYFPLNYIWHTKGFTLFLFGRCKYSCIFTVQ